ncbi:MAG: undecaprenyldiphospho-muramoylpentapeptide beta-N-acetylglucosaminyltransferase [Ignavibacteriae bacterium]|nr:undecaprenyldiphospho-muramoylpentapeptide beta-N-acetylglucosaminyltransferase [Ignavibacteriota bacterium]MCB9242557.1 undecaprenyldiphospho-muramoylpentapeptide beta-N-acetylglucosaminyltransferase [Ignavibacteriales bacterium]
MKVLFACGGTGGHIYPAIAIADEIMKRDENAGILFVGAKGKIEEKIVPDNGFELKTITIKGLDRKNFFKNITLPIKILGAVKDCRKIIREFGPDVAIGTGGYSSLPAIYAASKMGIPTLIQGGDSYPSKVTKFLSKYVSRVVINFEETRAHLKRKENIIRFSHPVRASLSRVSKEEAYELFGLDSGKRTLFIFGGSQGAKGINEAVENIIDKLREMNINIIWQTGKTDFDRLHEKYNDDSQDVKVYEFIEHIGHAYSIADLVVCRAGISSIMELSTLGLAALLIPYPFAAENHQEKNARTIERAKAGLVLEQNELKEKLFETIQSTLSNDVLLNEMRENIRQFSDPQAAEKIADEALKLVA